MTKEYILKRFADATLPDALAIALSGMAVRSRGSSDGYRTRTPDPRRATCN
jgi:hypothetical protein